MPQSDDEALDDWQIEETRKALAEADHGEFASDEEVQQALKKWLGRRMTPQKQATT